MFLALLLLASQLSPNVPQQVESIVQTRDGIKGCHATVVGIVQLLTAAHCIDSGELTWRGSFGALSGKSGVARLMWRDDARDLAMYQAIDPPNWPRVKITKERPSSQDPLYYIIQLYKGDIDVVAKAAYLGVDGEGDLAAFGIIPGGASGGGLLNAAGELIAVVTAGAKEHPVLFAKPITAWPQPGKK